MCVFCINYFGAKNGVKQKGFFLSLKCLQIKTNIKQGTIKPQKYCLVFLVLNFLWLEANGKQACQQSRTPSAKQASCKALFKSNQAEYPKVGSLLHCKQFSIYVFPKKI